MAGLLGGDVFAIEKLKSSENFEMWKFQIEITLKSESLYGLVEDTDKLEDQTTSVLQDSWKKRDAKTQRFILSTIEQGPKLHVTTCKTAKEMFDKICIVYERNKDQQKYKALQDFFSIKYDKADNIPTHICKIQSLAFKIRSLNGTIDDDMLMSKILSTLPEKFKYFHSAWDSTPINEKTLDNLTARLMSEENRNSTESNTKDNVAFKSTERSCFKCNKSGHIARNCTSINKKITCFNCGEYGHKQNECNKQKPKKCSICKKTNHTDDNCFFNKDKNKNKEKLSFMVGDGESDDWIIDSGCTSHMVKNKNMLQSGENIGTEIGVAKKNEKMRAEMTGTVETDKCVMKDVMYVPDLSRNLISVSAITDKDGVVIFKKEKVEILKNGELVLEGRKQKNGLYSIDLNKNNEALIVKEENKLDVWHKRLGHLSVENIKKLGSMVNGLNIPEKDFKTGKEICNTCALTKQTRMPFLTERNKATRPLQIIHSDICGPFEQDTWDGNKYFVTFLDDYTHFLYVKLLKGKYELFNALKDYVSEAEAKWNMKVANIRCDNGGEYKSNSLKEWTKQKGIKMDYTVPYTPQLNGKAERINRTLTEKVRALLKDSELNKEMWGEALYTATYLINRSPMSNMNVTPAEKWYGKVPNMQYVKLFGSKVYAKRLGNIKKLENRSDEYILVGYGNNCYRLWDKLKRRIIVSRDVIVNEQLNEIKRNNEIYVINEKEVSLDEEADETNEVDIDCVQSEDSDNFEDAFEDAKESSDEEIKDKNKNDQQNIKLNVRRSKRESKIPGYLNDYAMLTYDEALKGEDKSKWKTAIQEEKESLMKNKTWSVTDEKKANGAKILNN